jgi:hypothetical protein
VTPIVPSITLAPAPASCLRFWIRGADQVSYALEFSSDLVNWQPAGIWLRPQSGTWDLCSQVSGPDHGFYRLVMH